jgi:hypothetical protein
MADVQCVWPPSPSLDLPRARNPAATRNPSARPRFDCSSALFSSFFHLLLGATPRSSSTPTRADSSAPPLPHAPERWPAGQPWRLGGRGDASPPQWWPHACAWFSCPLAPSPAAVTAGVSGRAIGISRVRRSATPLPSPMSSSSQPLAPASSRSSTMSPRSASYSGVSVYCRSEWGPQSPKLLTILHSFSVKSSHRTG